MANRLQCVEYRIIEGNSKCLKFFNDTMQTGKQSKHTEKGGGWGRAGEEWEVEGERVKRVEGGTEGKEQHQKRISLLGEKFLLPKFVNKNIKRNKGERHDKCSEKG